MTSNRFEKAAQAIISIFKKYPPEITEIDRNIQMGDILDRVRANPLDYFFCENGKSYEWPTQMNNFLPNININACGMQIGYIHSMNFFPDNPQDLVVGHLAVEIGFERKGLGTAFVRALQEKVLATYGISNLIFAEIHTRRDAAGYPQFLESLGGIKQPITQHFTRERWLLQ